MVKPLKQRLEARGEKLWINVNFVGKSGFVTGTDNYSMQLYADQVLKTYQHMQATHGFVPDSWEIALEPGTTTPPMAQLSRTNGTTKTSQAQRKVTRPVTATPTSTTRPTNV